MKMIRIVALALLIVFAGIQFIPAERNQSNVVPVSDFMKVYEVPKEVERMIKVSCYDCHSNNTNYPWYDKVRPVSWFLEKHVREGKAELNFHEFDEYSGRRKISKLKSIRNEIEDGKMPLSSYIWMHKEAKISEVDKKLVLEWVDELIAEQERK